LRLLLDTNVLLWQLDMVDGNKLGPKSARLIKEASVVYVSTISIIEMQIKTMSGKLDAPKDCVSMITVAGDKVLPFDGESADAIRLFSKLTRHDPFDRMLLAQAYSENLTLLTADAALLRLEFGYVTDARK